MIIIITIKYVLIFEQRLIFIFHFTVWGIDNPARNFDNVLINLAALHIFSSQCLLICVDLKAAVQ